MGSRYKRFAPIGLLISAIGLIAAIGLFLIQREWNLAIQISIGMVVIGLGLFALLDPERVRKVLTGRSVRYGSNALILSVAFIGILVIVSYLVYQDSAKNPRRVDLTEDREFTLTPETLDVLENLEQAVFVQAFYSTERPSETALSLLEQYKIYSNGKFDYEFIDPYSDPVAAEQANIVQDGSLVFRMGDNQQIITIPSEQEMTSALIKLMNPEQRVVYFLTGHGENSPDGTGDQGYTQVKRILESKNYQVEILNLLATNQVPEDAAVIVVAGPQKPVSSEEVDLLSDYLSTGKALLVMQEPVLLTDFGDADDPLARYLSESWGIILGEDLVIDQTSLRPVDAVGAVWGNHQIVTNLQGYVVILPGARSVTVSAAGEGVSQTTLVSTSEQSWAETDLVALATENAEIGFNQDTDVAGPVPLGVVAENFNEDGRLVVFGDADFASDANIQYYGNADLFINSIDWAAGEEELISLTPKESTQRLLVTPDTTMVNLIFLISVIIIPGSALVLGVFTWYQRRRRG